MQVSGHLYIPAALPQRKSPWYPLDRRLGWPQSQFGCGGEGKNSQPLPRLVKFYSSFSFLLSFFLSFFLFNK
jgi:hypothetical protein